MKVQFKLGYYGYIVEQTDVPSLMEIFSRAVTSDGTFVNVSLEEAPDIERNKLEASIREELKNTLVAESQRYSNYWLQERAESEKLRKRIKELEEAQNEPL